MVNKTTKEAIIGLRRKNEARMRIGRLLYSMYRQKKDRIHGVKVICGLLHMDPRVLNKHIDFRIYPQEGREKSILHLDSEDMDTIKKTTEIFLNFKKLEPERQKIAQYIFLHLLKHG